MDYDLEAYEGLKQSEYARTSVLVGMVSETYARWKLQEQGYNVVKIVRLGREEKNKGDKSYFYLNLQFIQNAILKNYNGNKEAVIKLLKENIKGLPDFICYKNGEISFVEVKSNGVSPSEAQVKEFEYLERLGFKVKVMNIKVNLEVSEM